MENNQNSQETFPAVSGIYVAPMPNGRIAIYDGETMQIAESDDEGKTWCVIHEVAKTP